MSAQELNSLIEELERLTTHLRERISKEMRSEHALEAFKVHVSSLRVVPDRFERAVATYIRSGMLPEELKFQDAFQLRWRADSSVMILSYVLQRMRIIEQQCGSAVGSLAMWQKLYRALLKEDLKLKFPDLDVSKLDGERSDVLRWLLIDAFNQVPERFLDAVARIASENLRVAKAQGVFGVTP
jgi:hypothetical protein